VARWRERAPEEIQSAGSRVGEGRDPSRHGRVVYRYALAGAADVDRALTIARTAQPAWGALSINERGARLEACAAEAGRRRGDLIAAMIVDGAKTVTAADVEVSETVDFARYHALTLCKPADELRDC